MLNVLIVDDEPLERQAIRMILDTCRSNYRVVGEAADGEQALYLARYLKPDVILLDIRMPILDGMEVARILRPELPATRFVIVSAYGEFDYARQAVALGISQYLLKPVDTQELVELLDRLNEEVLGERKSRQEMEKLRATLQDVMPLIQVGFVMDLINGSLTNEAEVRTRAQFLGIHSIPRAAMHVWIDNLSGQHTYLSELESQILQKQVGDCIQEAVKEWPGTMVVPMGNGRYVVLLCAVETADDRVIRETSQGLGDKICAMVRSRTKITVTVGLGRPSKGPGGLARSHEEALAAGEYRFLYGGDQAIHADDVMSPQDSRILLEEGSEKGMALSIRMGDWEKSKQYLMSLWGNFSAKGKFNAADVRMKLLEITALASRAAVEAGVAPDEVAFFSVPSSREITSPEALASIQGQYLAWLSELVARVRASREFRNASLVDKAVRYVDDNYHQELSLEDAARQVFLSPCYFSRLFKQVKGWSFSEYLTQVRMEEAKKLLVNTDLMISEVATRVGYRDARYFSQVFKKMAGTTPGNFRRDASK